jgi:hypothetical protein
MIKIPFPKDSPQSTNEPLCDFFPVPPNAQLEASPPILFTLEILEQNPSLAVPYIVREIDTDIVSMNSQGSK